MKQHVNEVDQVIDSISSAFEQHPCAQVDQHSEIVDRDDARFIQQQLSRLPFTLQSVILKEAEKVRVTDEEKKTVSLRHKRNTFIREAARKVNSRLPEKLRQRDILGDEAIMNIAKECAERCRRTSLRYSFSSEGKFLVKCETANQYNVKSVTLTDFVEMDESLTDFYPSGGCVRNPLRKESCNEEARAGGESDGPICNSLRSMNEDSKRKRLLLELSSFAEQYGFALPTKNVTDKGIIKRLCDAAWWKKKLRKVVAPAYEHSFIELGQVSKHKEIYCSDFGTMLRSQQKQRNFNTLSSIFAINDDGQQYSLQELSDVNVSNPQVRKAELMVRMRGFEELSQERGEVGVFITITCPSKYHAVHAKSGQRNNKYQGYTPYQANQYLCDVWARIRSAWQKQNIAPYGFRVAEPQHDGTPHWHILLFSTPSDVQKIESIVRHYALLDDGDEKGAIENRCDFKRIDPKKGSATGYLAKYVSKNIDGIGLKKGVYGEDPISAAQRVDAWASCWCIRQFQQIGGAPVSVYRELRRLKTKLGEDEVLEQARKAADESSWSRYTTALGGLNTKRKDRPVSLAYEASTDYETGECKIGYYDNDVLKKLKGLYYKGQTFVTRFFNWKIVRGLNPTNCYQKIEPNPELSNLEYCK